MFRLLLTATLTTTLSACSLIPGSESPASKAKNVILFIGDGMGVSTVTAMRIHAGQLQGQSGEEYVLPFERFQHLALVKTYNSNQQVPDSAGTASAMHTGVKTRAGVLGIGPEARRGNCNEALLAQLPTLGEQAIERGVAVGIVSTARLTHATPASVYSHSPERDWEYDSAIPQTEREAGCVDIASQLLDFPFALALGGGLANFQDRAQGGKRDDGELLPSWHQQSQGSIAKTAAEMYSAPLDHPLLGLFSASHMSYVLDKTADSSEPSLAEMTAEAIRRLQAKGDGYYLLVEGGRIDHGHHQGQAGYALTEGVAFAEAVQAALDNTDSRDTLILVTADHSHVMTMGGYPVRGNPILGLVKENNAQGQPNKQASLAADGSSYTTLGYHNGPGAVSGQRRSPATGLRATQQALVPTGSGQLFETHGGEDVALYAHGPGAEQVRGVMEQNLIYTVIRRALGWE